MAMLPAITTCNLSPTLSGSVAPFHALKTSTKFNLNTPTFLCVFNPMTVLVGMSAQTKGTVRIVLFGMQSIRSSILQAILLCDLQWINCIEMVFSKVQLLKKGL